MIASHNADTAALHKRFAAFATKQAEEARSRQSHLEACLRTEIGKHDEISSELAAVSNFFASH